MKTDPVYQIFDGLHPKVSTKRNFDDLLFPMDHVSRKNTDTYFYDENSVLRTHCTAHQTEFLEKKIPAFLITGDVYRRDEIDASHYPVFHQVDGVRIYSRSEYLKYREGEETHVQFVERMLKMHLEGLAKALFGQTCEKRWVDAYFPFTHPSWELEIMFKDAWMECLGCGLVRSEILTSTGTDGVGYAFGMGLDRLAMILFNIPDIRLFWSEDPRFLDQFKSEKIVEFQPYSKYPACYKDLTFWLPPNFVDNDFYEEVRNVAGDLVENIKIKDEFTHPVSQRKSKCFRILYRHMDRSLTNAEVDEYQNQLRKNVKDKLQVELR